MPGIKITDYAGLQEAASGSAGSALSDGAVVILRYLKNQNAQQMEFVVPAKIAALFSDVEDCERAQAELYKAGLVDLGPDFPRHIPVKSRVRGVAITLEGERFLAKNDLG